MKVSYYTIFIKDSGFCYVYNTLSNALIQIDDETYEQLDVASKSSVQLSRKDLDGELYDVLEQNNILTNNDEDDFLAFKSILLNQRAQRSGMHLTIAPTMDCCFRCNYCFERYKEKIYMTPEVMDSIIKYILSCENLSSLSVTWFGGEPLMAIKEIEMFYDKLHLVWGDRSFSSNLITTGYHIDEEVIRVLKKVKVTSVQITLDGNRETHNRVKNFPGSGDVFEKVLNNVELYSRLAPDTNIVFRVNLTKENADEYKTLQDMILFRFRDRENVAISPAFVQDRSSIGCNPKKSVLFDHKSRSEFILNLASKGIDSAYIRYPSSMIYECAIRNVLSSSFDPEGYYYKCWEMIGNKQYALGKVSRDGIIENLNVVLYNRQLYGADPLDSPKCRKCKYLPLCCGGCPILRIENEFENANNELCTYYKGYLESFIKEHIKRKNLGFENRID